MKDDWLRCTDRSTVYPPGDGQLMPSLRWRQSPWGCIRVSGVVDWVALGARIHHQHTRSQIQVAHTNSELILLFNEWLEAHANECMSVCMSALLMEERTEHWVPARLTISIYLHVCPGNPAWNVADCHCISLLQVKWVQATQLPMYVCVSLSPSPFLRKLGENMEPLSASITHLIHHQCQAEEFWCQ